MSQNNRLEFYFVRLMLKYFCKWMKKWKGAVTHLSIVLFRWDRF